MSNIFKAIFPRPVPKARLSDVQERRGTVSEKAVEDFTRVCEQTGIFDQTKRLNDALETGNVHDVAKALREDR